MNTAVKTYSWTASTGAISSELLNVQTRITMRDGSTRMVVMMTVRKPVVNCTLVGGKGFGKTAEQFITGLGTVNGETLFPMIDIESWCFLKHCPAKGLNSFIQDFIQMLMLAVKIKLNAKIKNPRVGTK